MLKKPEWLQAKINLTQKNFIQTSGIVNNSGIATVCEEAFCPNISECWGMGTATFMIMGDTCTRACKFCAVKTSKHPPPLDENEPMNLAKAIKKLGLKYVVITSVDRDDLSDQGASHFAKSILEIRKYNPQVTIEVLTPDFRGERPLIEKIVHANPEVYGHNIETVKRLTPIVRDRRAGYEQSLSVLKTVKEVNPKMITKSSIILGLGETKEEVIETMNDLLEVDVDILTMGQYLQPTRKHYPVKRYIPPEEFDELAKIGERMGFKKVFAGPLVRSSYRAAEVFLSKSINNRS